jgi:hypothetical protein
MRQKSHSTDLSSEEIVKGIRRATRKRYSAEEKIRIVLDGLRGEHSIAELPGAKYGLSDAVVMRSRWEIVEKGEGPFQRKDQDRRAGEHLGLSGCETFMLLIECPKVQDCCQRAQAHADQVEPAPFLDQRSACRPSALGVH